MFETVKYVKSKYLIFAANDDFFIYENLNKCLIYLKSNRNFIGSGGTMIGFKIEKKNNKENKLTNFYSLYKYIKLDTIVIKKDLMLLSKIIVIFLEIVL